MYKDARNKAGLSTEAASFRLHVGRRTLVNYENGHSIVPPEVVLKMSEVYEQQVLCTQHCAKRCPIGQIFAHDVEERGLESAVLRLLKEHTDVRFVRDRLIEIAADGVVDEQELPDFEKIMVELLELEKTIGTMKLLATRILPMGELMKREKEKAARKATNSKRKNTPILYNGLE